MKYVLTFFILAFFCLDLSGARRFEYTPTAREAYEQVMSLRLEQARTTLARIKMQDPENLVVYHIENYIDFFTLFIQEDENLYKKLKANRDRRLSLIEEGDKSSPYYLFVQADIRLQWAITRLKFGDYLTAFTEVNKAYKLLEKNRALFPDFMPNLKDLGILHAVIGTIPDNYQWGVKLLSGMDGTIMQGRKEIEQVLRYSSKHDFLFEKETAVLYAFLLMHLENEAEEAWQVIQRIELSPASNPLHCFVSANIAMRSGKNDEAIRLLAHRPQSRHFTDFPYLDFMHGTALLRKLDPAADVYLSRYLRAFDGRNFIKETHQKLAWSALVHGKTETYRKHMTACLQQGHLDTDSDKHAQEEAESGEVPHPVLLRARLLFDGGYYQRAYNYLRTYQLGFFEKEREQLEYTYRLGRIQHGLKYHDAALTHYDRTIRQGQNSSWYYACNAALKAGQICEELNRKTAAVDYYNACLDMKPSDYKTGLHQAAKAGLKRLKE